jgi:AraC-like DNA-binding protein
MMRATSEMPPRSDPVVAAALSVILEHACDPKLRLLDVANAIRVPVRSLSRRLNHHSGETFRDIVHDARCERGARLLGETTLSVKEVSAAVGYPSPSDFIREFKRRQGWTPKAHRSKVRPTCG